MCGKKNRAKLVLVLFAEKWLGLKKIHVPKLFSPPPPPSHNPVRPLLTFIMEEIFAMKPLVITLIYKLFDSYNEHADS